MLRFATGGVESMQIREHINGFWGVAREGSPDGERLRRRIAAVGAMTLLFGGFLAAIGLGTVVLAFFGGVLISLAALGLLAVWPRVRNRLAAGNSRLRSRGRGTAAALAPVWQRARSGATTGVHRARRSSASGVASMSRRASALFGSAGQSGSRLGRGLAEKARSTTIRMPSVPRRAEPQQREALRLNAAGTQHRRSGHYEEAVECHRQALEILRTLDDRRAVALTQSNLALALSHSGDDEWAIGLFEEATATLHELGDQEHEARIMANLGLAHRRHGRPEEADNVLQLALTKLSPDSSAYHTIEAELRRAS
jgi:tetratricopeptide (TPR) repeat protein